MDPITMSLIGLGIGGVVGGSGLLGGLFTNSANAREARRARKTAINLANTAHQREVKDLRKAGLNPILSAGGSGAMTPTLATAQYENPAKDIGSDVLSGLQMADAMSKIELQGAQSAKLNAETAKLNAELPKSQAEGDVYKGLTRKGKDFFDVISDGDTYKGMWNGVKSLFPSSNAKGANNSSSTPSVPRSGAHGLSSDEQMERNMRQSIKNPNLEDVYDLSSARLVPVQFEEIDGKPAPFRHVRIFNKKKGYFEEIYIPRDVYEEKVKPHIKRRKNK